jgi:hypothetical protein
MRSRRGGSRKTSQNVARYIPQKWLLNEQWEASLATKRTVRITIDTSRLLVIIRGTSARIWCEQCATEVDMVPVESAAELARVDVQTVRHLLANKNIHLSQLGGPVQICLNSLLKEIV